MNEEEEPSVAKPDVESAFVSLIVSHQAALRAYVKSLMPGDSEADDVVQEANTIIWEKRGEFAIGTNFKAWMFSIARFKVLSHWRNRKRKRLWVFSQDTLQQMIDQMEEDGFEGIDEREQMLEQCLEGLRPEDRGLILFRYLEGGSIKGLAAKVGRTVESVRVSLHRVRGVLRECIRRKINRAEATT